MAARRTLVLLTLLMVVVSLTGTSCAPSGTSWQLPQPIKVENGEKWYNLFPSWITWGSAVAEGKTGAMLLRDGDLVWLKVGTKNGPIFVYKKSDGPALKATFEEWCTILAGRVVSVSLEKGEDGWDWIEKASAKDLAGVRFLALPDDLDAGRLPTLKKLAAASPNIGLMVDNRLVLLQVLPLFKPHVLFLGEMSLDAEERKIMTDQKQLETLIVLGKEPGNLDFLIGLPRLRRLAIGDRELKKVDMLPKGLKRLKSLLIINSTIEDVSALANAPAGLEELSLMCEKLSDVRGLAKLPALKTVILNHSEKVLDLSSLAGLKELKWMGLPPRISQEQFAGFVKTHPRLKVLEMVECKNLEDLTPLRDLKGLEGLVLVGEYKNLHVVQELKSLRFVAIPNKTFVESPDQIAAIQKALPDALVVSSTPLCLGSGWILLLIPAVVLLWLLRLKLWRRPAIGKRYA